MLVESGFLGRGAAENLFKHHRSQGLLIEEQEGAAAMVWWPGGYDKVAFRGWDVELVEVALAG